jgi:hypothetical protein
MRANIYFPCGIEITLPELWRPPSLAFGHLSRFAGENNLKVTNQKSGFGNKSKTGLLQSKVRVLAIS